MRGFEKRFIFKEAMKGNSPAPNGPLQEKNMVFGVPLSRYGFLPGSTAGIARFRRAH